MSCCKTKFFWHESYSGTFGDLCCSTFPTEDTQQRFDTVSNIQKGDMATPRGVSYRAASHILLLGRSYVGTESNSFQPEGKFLKGWKCNIVDFNSMNFLPTFNGTFYNSLVMQCPTVMLCNIFADIIIIYSTLM